MVDLSRLWTPRTLRLAEALSSVGREARVVGGAVRDALAGHAPKDTDIATDATPQEMLELGARLGMRTVPTLAEVQSDPREWERGGLRHGTVPFLIEGELIEATTLRVDMATDGRHAEVAFVRDFDADAARRDLTFNAMSVDASGRLRDPFGGADDLASGTVRFVGDADTRIREDYLRILRYFRFRARFGARGQHGPIETATEDAIRRNAGGMARISGERIWQEMSRILSVPEGIEQLPGLRRTGVADQIGLPVHAACLVAAERAAVHGACAPVVLGILLSPATGGTEVTAEDIKARWKLSTDEADLAGFARAHAGMTAEPLAVFQRIATRPRARPDRVAALLRGLGRPADARAVETALPAFPVRGADLVAAGLTGQVVGEVMVLLHAEWAETGFVATRDELLASLRDSPGRLPGGP